MSKIIEEAARDYKEQQTGLDYIGEVAVEQAFKDGAEYMKNFIFNVLFRKDNGCEENRPGVEIAKFHKKR